MKYTKKRKYSKTGSIGLFQKLPPHRPHLFFCCILLSANGFFRLKVTGCIAHLLKMYKNNLPNHEQSQKFKLRA